MRSTSAAEASSRRARWSTKPLASSRSGVSLSASMQCVLIPVVSKPPRRKPLPPFLLQDFINQAVIFAGISRDHIQDEGTELQGEGPLPHFPQFVVVLPLRPHDGNLVNGRVVEPDLAINGPNGGLARFRVGDVQ